MSSFFDLPFEEPEPDTQGTQPAPGAAPVAPDVRRVLTVSELTERIRVFLEEKFV